METNEVHALITWMDTISLAIKSKGIVRENAIIHIGIYQDHYKKIVRENEIKAKAKRELASEILNNTYDIEGEKCSTYMDRLRKKLNGLLNL